MKYKVDSYLVSIKKNGLFYLFYFLSCKFLFFKLYVSVCRQVLKLKRNLYSFISSFEFII